MEFDLSKENVQPLRGGRNPQQLGMALQAQGNRELQQELERQKEEFERAITAYEGDDPLDNYYRYISWVEQSYPKHGHEGNLSALLEHCLGKFENDAKYTDDRRFCKLWIKYIDLQQNPLELYHMLYSRGLCRGCSDMYRAWSYYHEAAEDFQNANKVLELGKQAIAQPYEELEAAYKNLLVVAGQYSIHGPDATRSFLQEKRQALTSLKTLKPGRVSSIRHGGGSTAGLSTANGPVTNQRANAAINVLEDTQSGAYSGGYEAAPVSIITAARQQDAPKENTLKPGPWTTLAPGKRRQLEPSHKPMPFTVHEDSDSQEYDFHATVPRQCLETYADWRPNIKMSEPFDPRAIAMYPKERVYIDPQTEYSIEELRAHRYTNRRKRTTANVLQSTTLLHSMADYSLMGGGTSYAHYHHNMDANAMAIPQALEASVPIPLPELFNSTLKDASIANGASPGPMSPVVRTLHPDELVETGSRGGMAVAATAQSTDCAQSTPMVFNEDSAHHVLDLDASCNTHVFNLNCMHVSTPDSKRPSMQNNASEDALSNSRKQLFVEASNEQQQQQPALSVILEEVSDENNTAAAQQQQKTIEEHNSYLAQNMMANAALRSSLLGNLMDGYQSPQQSTTQHSHSQQQQQTPTRQTHYQQSQIISILDDSVRLVPQPMISEPLDYVPDNPFDKELVGMLLQRVGFPGVHREGFIQLPSIPKIVVRKEPIYLGGDRYIIEKVVGKGTYGVVYRATDLHNLPVALKSQSSPNLWEFYICREIQARLQDSTARHNYMDISKGYFGPGQCVYVSEFMPYGTLLDLTNQIKQQTGKAMKETLSIYFAIEMLRIVQTLHSVHIIHADIKPDNFLVFVRPDNTLGLQLIDFGCSIDMKLFPPGAQFRHKITTDSFVCCEMRDNRPWSYHTDLYCVAASVHVLVIERYIDMQKSGDLWAITHRFQRYNKGDTWNAFFNQLLNQQSGPADVEPIIDMLQQTLDTMSSFQADLRCVVNILKNR